MRWIPLVVLVGCGSSQADTPKKVDACSAEALKLGKTTPLAAWQPPKGCTSKGANGKTVLSTKAELDAAFTCDKGVSLGIDPAKQSLVQVAWMMSPAAVGLDAHDDGKTVTLVTRFRSPCPKDPRPMPMTMTRWFVMPAGGPARTWGEATCTVDTKCP